MTRKSMGFRLSFAAQEHLRTLQHRTGLSQTAVVEMALALAVYHFKPAPPPLDTTDDAARTAVMRLDVPE